MADHKVASFKHDINAQLRCISPIWTLSHSAHDIGGIWMSPTLVSYRIEMSSKESKKGLGIFAQTQKSLKILESQSISFCL